LLSPVRMAVTLNCGSAPLNLPKKASKVRSNTRVGGPVVAIYGSVYSFGVNTITATRDPIASRRNDSHGSARIQQSCATNFKAEPQCIDKVRDHQPSEEITQPSRYTASNGCEVSKSAYSERAKKTICVNPHCA
jgi:hypothetical protein